MKNYKYISKQIHPKGQQFKQKIQIVSQVLYRKFAQSRTSNEKMVLQTNLIITARAGVTLFYR